MMKKFGFTLAEVLITLAIIGVVAAMTIPTLIANYQERSWNTSATVFDRKLTEALKIMNSQGTLAGRVTTENFVKELSKHLKIVRTCDNSNLTDCFVDSMTMRENTITVDLNNISTSADLGQSDWDTNIVGFQLANGTNALVAYNPDCKQDPYSNQITGSDCLAIMYDTTGFKSPNHLSKDLRANANVKKVNSKLVCALEVDGTCFGTPFYPTPHRWNACSKWSETEDAEDLAIMAKYNLNHCMSLYQGQDDYWLGAVKQCGGIEKMPSMEDLTALANKLYGTTEIDEPDEEWWCPGEKYSICMTPFPGQVGPDLRVWSNESDGSSMALGRLFAKWVTWHINTGQDDYDMQAICVEN